MKANKLDEVDAGIAPEREFFSPERALKEMYPTPYKEDSLSPTTSKDDLNYRFSISQLPSWAKKKVIYTRQRRTKKARSCRIGECRYDLLSF